MPTPTPSAGSLARKAHSHVFGILVLGLLAAIGLGYSGYLVYEINASMRQYAEFALTRAQAQSLLNEIEISFTRFLLDGNSANQALMQRDRAELEQLAQSEPSGNDQVLKNMIDQERRWYAQVAPLIEQRKNVSPGQGLSEDFLAHYRASGTSLALVTPDASQGFSSSHQETPYIQLSVWLAVGYFAAAILMVLGVCALAWGAFKNIAGLRKSLAPNPPAKP
jgi:hypothetical protein